MIDLAAVLAEHHSYDGFVEGANNDNPFSAWFGVPHVAYCAGEATGVPHRHGLDWGPDAQFPHLGLLYSPYILTWAVKHGLWEPDHTSSGKPCSAHTGDIGLCDWNSDGVADHTVTIIADRVGSGPVNTFEANAGHPEGCHWSMWRPPQYLLGVVHMCRWAYKADGPAPAPAPTPPPTPVPPPPPPGDGNPFCPLTVDGQFGPGTIKALQWRLNLDGANPKINVNGVYGPDTKRNIQARLNWAHPPVAIDGQIGPQTIRVLQRHVGAPVDGQWGPATTRSLQLSLNGAAF